MSINRHVEDCLSFATPTTVAQIQMQLQISANSVTKAIKRLQIAKIAVRVGTSRYPCYYLRTAVSEGASYVPLTTTQYAIRNAPSSVWALGAMAK